MNLSVQLNFVRSFPLHVEHLMGGLQAYQCRLLSEALPGRPCTKQAGTQRRPGERCPCPRCGKCHPGYNTWRIALSPQRQGAEEHRKKRHLQKCFVSQTYYVAYIHSNQDKLDYTRNGFSQIDKPKSQRATSLALAFSVEMVRTLGMAVNYEYLS